MTEELTPSEKLERMARASEYMRTMRRYVRRAAGLSETPLRTRAIDLLESRLREGGFAQRGLGGVYVDERFKRPLRFLVEARRRRLSQEEAPAKKPEPGREPEEELGFDFSPIFY